MRWMFTLALLLGMGCAPYVHSPPGRTLPLESPKALFPRETEFQVEGGGLGGAEIGLPSFKLRVRHGIVKHLDANAEFNFGKIRADHWFRFVGANPYVFAGGSASSTRSSITSRSRAGSRWEDGPAEASPVLTSRSFSATKPRI